MITPKAISSLEDKYSVSFHHSTYSNGGGHYALQLEDGSWLCYMVEENVFNIVGFFIKDIKKENLTQKQVAREIRKIKWSAHFK